MLFRIATYSIMVSTDMRVRVMARVHVYIGKKNWQMNK